MSENNKNFKRIILVMIIAVGILYYFVTRDDGSSIEKRMNTIKKIEYSDLF